MRVGVVVEGGKDVPIFEELLPKIDSQILRVVARPARGKSRFMAVFPDLLWSLQHVEPRGPADKAIVVRDANGDDPAVVEAVMRKRLEERRHPLFPRGVEVHATRRESETWLLADVEAINRVAVSKGGRRVGVVPGPLEVIPDAKEVFIRLLSQAGLPYVPEIVREIVREVDLSIVASQCPGFRIFSDKVRR